MRNKKSNARNSKGPQQSRSQQHRPQQGKLHQQKSMPRAAQNSDKNLERKSEIQIPKSWRAVIGFHAIREALQVFPKAAEMLWLRQGFESSQDLKELHTICRNKVSKIELKPEAALEKFGTSQQGAVLFVSESPAFDFNKLEHKENSIVVLADGLEDTHNLGAILRTSWLMGVDGLLIPQDRAVGLTPTVHKVACGGVEHVPVEVCTQFASNIEELKKMGYWVYGLSHLGKNTVYDLKLPEKVVWCVGSEDKGLRVTTERLCDELVRIPQVSAAASYNASVATAIALAETQRQHLLTTAKKN